MINILLITAWAIGLVLVFTAPRIAHIAWAIPAGWAAGTAIGELLLR